MSEGARHTLQRPYAKIRQHHEEQVYSVRRETQSEQRDIVLAEWARLPLNRERVDSPRWRRRLSLVHGRAVVHVGCSCRG
jgi:hypothetical protein